MKKNEPEKKRFPIIAAGAAVLAACLVLPAVISRIEKDFNVHFTFRDIVRFKNVGDICNAILTKTK